MLLEFLCFGHARVVRLVRGTLESSRTVNTSECSITTVAMLIQLGLLYDITTTITLKTKYNSSLLIFEIVPEPDTFVLT